MLTTRLAERLRALGVEQGRLLVAVSGGRDSIVLLDLLSTLARRSRGIELVVAHVHHGLRGAEADADQELVMRAAGALGWPFRLRRVDPEAARTAEGLTSRTRPSLEEAARDLRRAALVEIAEDTDCRWLATGHHLGDQAETVLLRILRGSGPDGLAAMAPISSDGRWIRPMLDFLPEEIAAWAARRELVWRHDQSNTDRRFARNRLRHDWLPGLRDAFNPKLLQSLSQLAEAQRADREWIDGLVRLAAEERIESHATGIRLAIDGWASLPPALARRLVRHAFERAGLPRRDLARVHVDRVLAFLSRGRGAGRDKRLELPGGFRLRRRGDAFELTQASAANGLEPCTDATVPMRD